MCTIDVVSRPWAAAGVPAGPDRRRLLDGFFALSQDLLCVATLDGFLLEVNPAWERVLRCSREDLLGVRYLDLVHPEDVDATVEAASGLARGEQVTGFENRYRRSDGTYRWFSWTSSPSVEDGLVYAVVRDVTEERRRRAWADELEHVSGVGTWEFDLDNGGTVWSAHTFAIYGLPPTPDGRVTVEQGFEHYPPEAEAVLGPAFERLLADGTPYDLEVPFRTAEGEHRWIRTTGRAHRRHGRTVRIYGSIQDVTDQHRLEADLTRSEEQLQRILASTRDGWWETDLVQGTATHSERWWELHGYEPGSLPSTPTLWRRFTDPADLPRIDARYAEALEARSPSMDLYGSVVHRDGTRIPVAVRALVEYDEAGRPVRISGTTRDIRDVVRTQQLQDTFLSTVSHELRTPLSSIGGAVELLQAGRGGELSPAATVLLDVAQRNAVRLRRLIDDLLDAERLASGRQRFAFQRVALVDVLDRAVQDVRGVAVLAQVEVTLAAGDGLRPQVCADPMRVEQVVTNYLANACRYAPPDTTVEVRCLADGDDAVRVEVIDRGSGVPVAFRSRVFERFAQAEASDVRSQGGTGLGLSISREIVERHGGRVGFTSRPGRTCFWFTLPTDPGSCDQARRVG